MFKKRYNETNVLLKFITTAMHESYVGICSHIQRSRLVAKRAATGLVDAMTAVSTRLT